MAKVSRSNFNKYASDIDALAAASKKYVAALVYDGILNEGIDYNDLASIRNYSIGILKDAYGIYGDQAGTYAATVYDNIAAANDIITEGAEVVLEYDAKTLENDVRYDVGKIKTQGFEKFVDSVSQRAYEHTRRTANSTMMFNADRDFDKGMRWARIPSGTKTCGFCVMLASRGFAYHSKESAGDIGLTFNRFHDFCDCRVVSGTMDTVVEGYDPDWLLQVYLDARETVIKYAKEKHASLKGSSHAKAITNEIVKEINTRDPGWVYHREVPEVTFENEEVKAEKYKNRLAEIGTAEKLSEHGIACHFPKDEIYDGGIVIGLADLANGYEIKTLEGTDSKNTINGHLKKSSKKKNAIAVVFDNTGNSLATDAELETLIMRCHSFKRGRIYILGNEYGYKRIK